jgi:hypothetical protein
MTFATQLPGVPVCVRGSHGASGAQLGPERPGAHWQFGGVPTRLAPHAPVGPVGFANVCWEHLLSKMNSGSLHWQPAACGTSPTLHARVVGAVGLASVCCAHLPSNMNSGSLHRQFTACGTSPTLQARSGGGSGSGFASVCCAHLPSKMNSGAVHWQPAACGTSPTLQAREVGAVGFASVCCAHLPSKMNSGAVHWQPAVCGASPTLQALGPAGGGTTVGSVLVTFATTQFGGAPVHPEAQVCRVVTTPLGSVVLVV